MTVENEAFACSGFMRFWDFSEAFKVIFRAFFAGVFVCFWSFTRGFFGGFFFLFWALPTRGRAFGGISAGNALSVQTLRSPNPYGTINP